MKKIENPEVKDFLIELVSTELEKDEIFTKVFQEGFAYDRLENNVKYVFTDEFSMSTQGYQSYTQKAITLCTNEPDNQVTTPEVLEKNQDMISTAVHEAIHAILSRNQEECERFNIIYGVGIYEVIQNKKGEYIEVGRGLNEGITNWICNRLKYQTNSYQVFTNFIYELELALGSEQVMRLGKGNIRENIAKILKMSESECIAFLIKIDLIYQIQDQKLMLEVWRKILKNHKDGVSKEISKTYLENAYNVLQKNDEYIKMLQSKNYNRFLEEKSLLDTDLSRIEYIRNVIDKKRTKIQEIILEIENTIFDKYFRDEWEAILSSPKIKTDTFEKFNRLNKLRIKIELPPIQHEYQDLFMIQFKRFKGEYFDAILKFLENSYRGKDLTFDKVDFMLEHVSKMGQKQFFVAIKEIAKLMCPKATVEVATLIYYLYKQGRLEDIDKYYIYSASVKGEYIPLFFRNGQLEFTYNNISSKKTNVNNDTKISEEMFDFTFKMNEDEQKIIDEFIKMRDIAKKINPNTNIVISGRTIAFDFGKSVKIYYIKDGDMVPMEVSEENPINVQFQQYRKNHVLNTKHIQSLISKLKYKIKNFIFENKQEYCYNHNFPVIANCDEANNFRNRIKEYSSEEPANSEIIREEDEENNLSK